MERAWISWIVISRIGSRHVGLMEVFAGNVGLVRPVLYEPWRYEMELEVHV
ncbi:hypothetical protein Tco_1230160, partial [Tanacetum coccineum]